jgi:competence protein ComEC
MIDGWDVLHPEPEADSPRAADRTLVLRLSRPSVLACGDLSLEGQRAVLAAERARLAADILLVSLPAKENSIAPEFIAAVHPKWVIVHGAQPFRAPKGIRSLRQQLRAAGIPVWFVDRYGAVTIEATQNGRTIIEGEGRRVELASGLR